MAPLMLFGLMQSLIHVEQVGWLLTISTPEAKFLVIGCPQIAFEQNHGCLVTPEDAHKMFDKIGNNRTITIHHIISKPGIRILVLGVELYHADTNGSSGVI
jgi:hypothetical protein